MIRAGLAGAPTEVDVLVVGLGVTGAGVALDAVTRGLSVLAVDAHDLAFGTSRWSSKMVHGGLRYLAKGQVGVAHESAVERGILMEVTAPHLTRSMPMVIPINSSMSRLQGGLARAGLRAGDLLRRGARTDAETLPQPRHMSATETLAMVPALRPSGLRGGLLGWDGQLEDDARLVVTMGRTAADHWPTESRPRVIDALARVTRDLHALPLEDCPFDRRLEVSIPEAMEAQVDLADLDPERRGWSRERLVAELLSDRPEQEDLVVCHGDLCLPNVLVDPDSFAVTGVIDAGRLGIADRWTDLAIATRSLASPQNPQFGEWAAQRYLTAYGVSLDIQKCDYYRLLDEFF